MKKWPRCGFPSHLQFFPTDTTPRQPCPVLLIPLMRPKQGRNMLRALTAEGKQSETQVPASFSPCWKGSAMGKSGVGTPCRPPASPPDHPPRPHIADCTLYIGLLSAKMTTMRASPIQCELNVIAGKALPGKRVLEYRCTNGN